MHKLSTTTCSTNHQEALRAKYLKLSGSLYGKEFTKYQDAGRAKYQQNINRHVQQNIHKLSRSRNAKYKEIKP
jgi:hypothetical protein